MKTAIVTGIAGGLAGLVARRLKEEGYKVIGVDYRPMRSELPFVDHVYQANYNKTKIEDVFRRHPPSHVLHLGRVGNLKQTIKKRFDLNVIGSRKVMDLAGRYGAKRMVVLSTFHIYGAHPHNHIPIYEDEPLRAGMESPQIGDAIQLDNQAITWTYQHPECKTAILRPTNVIGPNIKNAMSNFLRSKRGPVMMGFDPMVQFIHENDLVDALVAVAAGEAVGIYNVVGQGTLPWRTALDVVGMQQIPIPSTAAIGYLKMVGLMSRALPPYMVNFFMYPCVISDAKIRETFDFAPSVAIEDALRSTRLASG